MSKYTLLSPISIGKKQITELNLRDHTTADDYLSFDRRGGVAQRIALISNLSGTDEEVIKRISGKDYVQLERIVSKMLDDDAGIEDEDAEKKSQELSEQSL